MPRCAGGKTRIISVCDIGMIGPPQSPCMHPEQHQEAERRRKAAERRADAEADHAGDEHPHARRTAAASQPVSGTMIASATE